MSCHLSIASWMVLKRSEIIKVAFAIMNTSCLSVLSFLRKKCSCPVCPFNQGYASDEQTRQSRSGHCSRSQFALGVRLLIVKRPRSVDSLKGFGGCVIMSALLVSPLILMTVSALLRSASATTKGARPRCLILPAPQHDEFPSAVHAHVRLQVHPISFKRFLVKMPRADPLTNSMYLASPLDELCCWCCSAHSSMA